MSVDNNAKNVQPSNHVGGQRLSCPTAFIKRLLSRKPMGQLQAEIDTLNEMRRSLNGIHLTAVGLGCTIGAGIFSLSGQAAANNAGPSVIVAFIITGVVAILAALSFSEMAAMMPSSGSAYSYTYVALGEYGAWFIGWNSALLYQMATLTVVVDWSKKVVKFVDIVSDYNATSWAIQGPVVWNEAAVTFQRTGQVINMPAIALTIVITIVLFIGIRETAMVNLVLVAIKITILLIFIFVCCKYVNTDNYKHFIPSNQGSFDKYGVTGLLKACTYVFFAHVGFDSVATAAQEARTPQRWLPRAIIASTIISLLIYVGICTVMVGLLPYKSLNTTNPLEEVIRATPYGLWLEIVMTLGAIASLATVALMCLLSQTRVFYAMAHDGLLPAFFAKIHPHTKTPWISTIISGVFCTVIAGICPVDLVGETTSISALIMYIFVHIEVTVMRYTQRDMHRTFKVPFGPWLIPIVGSLLCLLLIAGISEATGIRYLVWTALGQIFYFSYGFWHSNRRQSQRVVPSNSAIELLPTIDGTMIKYADVGSEPDLVKEIIDSKA